jgi:hypothetical protein
LPPSERLESWLFTVTNQKGYWQRAAGKECFDQHGFSISNEPTVSNMNEVSIEFHHKSLPGYKSGRLFLLKEMKSMDHFSYGIPFLIFLFTLLVGVRFL